MPLVEAEAVVPTPLPLLLLLLPFVLPFVLAEEEDGDESALAAADLAEILPKPLGRLMSPGPKGSSSTPAPWHLCNARQDSRAHK